MEEYKDVLAAIGEQHNITQKEIAAKLGGKVGRVKYYLNKTDMTIMENLPCLTITHSTYRLRRDINNRISRLFAKV